VLYSITQVELTALISLVNLNKHQSMCKLLAILMLHYSKTPQFSILKTLVNLFCILSHTLLAQLKLVTYGHGSKTTGLCLLLL